MQSSSLTAISDADLAALSSITSTHVSRQPNVSDGLTIGNNNVSDISPPNSATSSSSLLTSTLLSVEQHAKVKDDLKCVKKGKCSCILNLFKYQEEEYNIICETIDRLQRKTTTKKTKRSIPDNSTKTGGRKLHASTTNIKRDQNDNSTTSSSSSSSSNTSSSSRSSAMSSENTLERVRMSLAKRLTQEGICMSGLSKILGSSRVGGSKLSTNYWYKETAATKRVYGKTRAAYVAYQEDDCNDADDEDDGDHFNFQVETEKINDTACCRDQCLQGFSLQFINMQRQRWMAKGSGSQLRRRRCVLEMLWNDLTNRRTNVCNKACKILLQASNNLISRCRKDLEEKSLTSAALEADHGMVEYIKELVKASKQQGTSNSSNKRERTKSSRLISKRQRNSLVGRTFYNDHLSDSDDSTIDYHVVTRVETESGVIVVYADIDETGDEEERWDESWVKDHLVKSST